MRKSTKEWINHKTMANLETMDVNNWLDYSTQLEEHSLIKELKANAGGLDHVQLKQFR